MLTGEVFDVLAAVDAGLVTIAVEPDELDAATERVAEAVRLTEPNAVAATRRLLVDLSAMEVGEGLRHAEAISTACCSARPRRLRGSPPSARSGRRSGPLVAEGSRMIGVVVTFQYDGVVDRERILLIATRGGSPFRGCVRSSLEDVHARRTRCPGDQRVRLGFGGRGARNFDESLLERVTALYGVRPSVDFVEIAALVENT